MTWEAFPDLSGLVAVSDEKRGGWDAFPDLSNLTPLQPARSVEHRPRKSDGIDITTGGAGDDLADKYIARHEGVKKALGKAASISAAPGQPNKMSGQQAREWALHQAGQALAPLGRALQAAMAPLSLPGEVANRAVGHVIAPPEEIDRWHERGGGFWQHPTASNVTIDTIAGHDVRNPIARALLDATAATLGTVQQVALDPFFWVGGGGAVSEVTKARAGASANRAAREVAAARMMEDLPLEETFRRGVTPIGESPQAAPRLEEGPIRTVAREVAEKAMKRQGVPEDLARARAEQMAHQAVRDVRREGEAIHRQAKWVAEQPVPEEEILRDRARYLTHAQDRKAGIELRRAERDRQVAQAAARDAARLDLLDDVEVRAGAQALGSYPDPAKMETPNLLEMVPNRRRLRSSEDLVAERYGDAPGRSYVERLEEEARSADQAKREAAEANIIARERVRAEERQRAENLQPPESPTPGPRREGPLRRGDRAEARGADGKEWFPVEVVDTMPRVTGPLRQQVLDAGLDPDGPWIQVRHGDQDHLMPAEAVRRPNAPAEAPALPYRDLQDMAEGRRVPRDEAETSALVRFLTDDEFRGSVRDQASREASEATTIEQARRVQALGQERPRPEVPVVQPRVPILETPPPGRLVSSGRESPPPRGPRNQSAGGTRGGSGQDRPSPEGQTPFEQSPPRRGFMFASDNVGRLDLAGARAALDSPGHQEVRQYMASLFDRLGMRYVLEDGVGEYVPEVGTRTFDNTVVATVEGYGSRLDLQYAGAEVRREFGQDSVLIFDTDRAPHEPEEAMLFFRVTRDRGAESTVREAIEQAGLRGRTFIDEAGDTRVALYLQTAEQVDAARSIASQFQAELSHAIGVGEFVDEAHGTGYIAEWERRSSSQGNTRRGPGQGGLPGRDASVQGEGPDRAGVPRQGGEGRAEGVVSAPPPDAPAAGAGGGGAPEFLERRDGPGGQGAPAPAQPSSPSSTPPPAPSGQAPPRPPGSNAVPARQASPPPRPLNARQVKSQAQIVRDLANKIARVTYGAGAKFRKKTLGRFHTSRDVVEVRDAADYSTTYHEIGHALDKRLGLIDDLPDAAQAHLRTLGADTGSGQVPGVSDRVVRQEGVAEMVRMWLEDPDELARRAPGLSEAFEQALEGQPALRNVLNRARADLEVRRRATALERLDSEIAMEGMPSQRMGWTDTATTAVEKFFNDLVHLEAASEAMAAAQGQKVLRAADDLGLQARMVRSRAEASMNAFVGERNALTGKHSGGQVRLVRNADGSTSREAIEGKRSLREILADVGDDPVVERDFIRYMVARRAEELQGRGMRTPFTPEDVKEALEELHGRYSDFDGLFREVVEWQDNVLQYAVDSGLVSREAASRMRELNQSYVPWARVFEVGAGELPETMKGIGKGLQTAVPSSLKSMKGSGREILNPIQTILNNTHALLYNAERNLVGQTLVRLWDENAEGVGRFFGREIQHPRQYIRARLQEMISGGQLRKDLDAYLKGLGTSAEDLGLSGEDLQAMVELFPEQTLVRKTSATPFGQNVVRVKDGDEWRFFQLKPAVYRSWTSLDAREANWIAKMMAPAAGIKRLGVTRELGFIVRNLVRDTFEASIVSDRVRLVPGQSIWRGIKAMLLKPELVEEYFRQGGAFATRTRQFTDSQWIGGVGAVMRGMSPTARRLTWLPASIRRRLPGLTHAPARLYEILGMLSEFSEDINRIGFFDKAMEQLRRENPDWSHADLASRAAFESRDIMDFSLRGTATRDLKMVIPFFQPTLTGTHRYLKAMRRDPVGTVARSIAWVGVPTALLYLANRKDEDYWQLPQQERDVFYHLRIGPGPEDFLRIPKPHLPGFLFGTMLQRTLQKVDREDPKAFQEVVQSLLEASLPVRFVPLGGDDARARVVPTPSSFGPLGDATVHLLFNYDPYRQRAVEPPQMDLGHVPSWLRYTDYTTATAKWLGQSGLAKVVGLSPIQIDQAMFTLGGSGGAGLMRLSDQAVSPATGIEKPVTRPRGMLEHVGLQKKTSHFEGADRFYGLLEQLRQKKAANRMAREPFTSRERSTLKQMESAAKSLKKLREELKDVQEPARRDALLLRMRRITDRFTPAAGPNAIERRR